jgi:hypothetical protein
MLSATLNVMTLDFEQRRCGTQKHLQTALALHVCCRSQAELQIPVVSCFSDLVDHVHYRWHLDWMLE